MKKDSFTVKKAFRWNRFDRKTYSVFCSLKKEVNIGVLSVATALAFFGFETAVA
ncbi:MAG: hypothetical protein LUD15_07085 [Bacteroides sp.]|nr:hypothetical protein [Bacteroides sp.]